MDKSWAEATDEIYETDVAKDFDDEEEDADEPEATDEPDGADEPDGGDSDEPAGDEGADDEDEPDKEEPAVDDPDPDSPPENLSSKDAIKAALRELDQERAVDTSTKAALKNEVLETLYPEGLERNLTDSEGKPIKTIEDVQELINPKTNDYFTEDEAGAWLLESQQKLNQNIQQMEDYAGVIVDTNLTLKEGAERVESVYGELLATMPDVADQVYAAYSKTLVKDPTSGIVLRAPVDVVEFYDVALAGYKNMASQMQTKQEKETAAKAAADAKAAKARQSERADLPNKGSDKEDIPADDWRHAYDDYFNG